VISSCDGSHYKIVGEPAAPDSGQRAFCSDESGTIRASADGKATSCLSSGEEIQGSAAATGAAAAVFDAQEQRQPAESPKSSGPMTLTPASPQSADPDLQTTGVMNHISLGVRDMKQAQAKLESHGWKPHDKDDHPEIGKDGKWQFDVFDPDFTRVELMEFKPVQKPCCSEFQGPHPSE